MRFASLLLAIWFFVQGISPMGFSELPKFGALIKHYAEHNEVESIGFFDFIALHYGSSKESKQHDKDDPHDGSLPFHGSVLKPIGSIVVLQVQTPNLCSVDRPIEVWYPPTCIGAPRSFSDEAFQPPRV